MLLEFHVHTNQSLCSNLSIKNIEDYLQKSEIDFLAVVDHDVKIPAELAANPKIIPGIEFTTNRGDIIGLFMNKPIESHDARKIVDFIHQEGGLVLIPHPFKKVQAHWDDFVKDIDLLEIYNPRVSDQANRQAEVFALMYNLKMVAGSDAHLKPELGLSLMEMKENTEKNELKKAIVTEKIKILKTLPTKSSAVWESKVRRKFRKKKYWQSMVQFVIWQFVKLREVLIGK